MELESWPGLTVTPPSQTWELFWATFAFQFVKYGASAYFFFFPLLSAQNEVNELLPVNYLLFLAVI